MSGVESPEVVTASKSSVAGPAPRLSDEEVVVARFASCSLQIVGGILAIFSVFTVWFYLSGGGVATQFYPGASFKANGKFMTYASQGLGPVGGLYDAILVLGVVGGALLLVGGALLLLEAVHRRPARPSRNTWIALSGVAVMAFAWVIAPGLQPWALHDSTATACSGWTGTSPCSLPWGSGSQMGVSYTFFMADGWIIMLGALTLATVGLVIGYLGRNPA